MSEIYPQSKPMDKAFINHIIFLPDMNKKKFNTLTGVIFILLIISLSSCQSTVKESNQLEVGVVIPLTGPVSQTGEDFMNGMFLAQDKLNSNVKLNIEDSQSNPKSGVSAARKLLDTKNIDVMVSLQSSVVIAVLPLADEKNIPLIAAAISQDEFTSLSENAFRLFYPAREDGGMAAELANDKSYKKVAIFNVQDEFGESMRKHFKKNFNGEITQEEAFLVSDRDFRTSLTKVSDDTDAVFFIGYIPHQIEFFNQKKELGKEFVVISNLIITSQLVIEEVGDIINNSYAIVPISTTFESDESKIFVEEFTAKYGKAPDWAAPFGYDMVLTLDAIQKSNKSPKEALYEIDIKGLNGQINFDEQRETNIPLTIIEY